MKTKTLTEAAAEYLDNNLDWKYFSKYNFKYFFKQGSFKSPLSLGATETFVTQVKNIDFSNPSFDYIKAFSNYIIGWIGLLVAFDNYIDIHKSDSVFNKWYDASQLPLCIVDHTFDITTLGFELPVKNIYNLGLTELKINFNINFNSMQLSDLDSFNKFIKSNVDLFISCDRKNTSSTFKHIKINKLFDIASLVSNLIADWHIKNR